MGAQEPLLAPPPPEMDPGQLHRQPALGACHQRLRICRQLQPVAAALALTHSYYAPEMNETRRGWTRRCNGSSPGVLILLIQDLQ
jgi:hypothetical protein